MNRARSVVFLSALALSACASVSTQVVPLNPAQTFPPTQFVEILRQKPERPHIEIAVIESRGGSEAELLNDAREKARALGADAIVRIETETRYHPPVAIHEPWHDPFYWRGNRHRYFSPFGPFSSPWGAYQMIPPSFSYVLKATAVKYTGPPG